MPHIILEHSENVKDQINYQEFFKSIVDLMLELEIVGDPDSIKSRFHKPEEYFLNRDNNILLHLEIALLSGRDKEKLQELGLAAKSLMHKFFQISDREFPQSFAVEVREINKDLYFK